MANWWARMWGQAEARSEVHDARQAPGRSRGLLAWARDFLGGWAGPRDAPDTDAGRDLSREISHGGPQNVVIPRFLPYLDDQTSETGEIRAAYRKMWASPQVKSALLGKLLGVAALDLQIQPAGKGPRAQAVADFVRWNLTQRLAGAVPGLVWSILSGGLVDGYSVGEKVIKYQDQGEHEGKWVLAAVKPRTVGLDLVLQTDSHLNVVGVQGLRYNSGVIYPPARFLIWRHLPLYDSPTGMSDLRAVYGSWWLLDTVKKLRGIHADKRAAGMLVGKYRQGDGASRAALEQTMSRARSDTWMSIPDDAQIEALDWAGSADDVYKSFAADMQEEIFLGIQLATLQALTGGLGVERGSSKVHKHTADLARWFLAESIEHALNDHDTGLVRDLVDLNFVVTDYPRATLSAVDVTEMGAEAQLDKILQDLGLDLDREETYERYGRTPPKDPAAVLKPKQQGQGPGAPGMPPGGGDGGNGGGKGGQPTSPPAKPSEPTAVAKHAEDAAGHEHGKDGKFTSKAHRLSKKAGELSNQRKEWAGKGEETADYTGPASEAIHHAKNAVKALESGDHALAREYHRSAAYEHEGAAEGHRGYSGADIRHEEAAKEHLKAAKAHEHAARALEGAEKHAEDAAGHEHGKDGKFTSKGSGDASGNLKQGSLFDPRPEPEPASTEPPAKKAAYDPGMAYGRTIKAANKHRQNMRAMMGAMQRGDYSPEDALHDVDIYTADAAKHIRTGYAEQLRRLSDVAAEKYGPEALRSQEWADVRRAFRRGADVAASHLDEMADPVRATAEYHLRPENAGKDVEIGRSDLDTIDHHHANLEKHPALAFERIGDALDAFKAAHKPVAKHVEGFDPFAEDAAGHEHAADGKFAARGGGGSAAAKDDAPKRSEPKPDADRKEIPGRDRSTRSEATQTGTSPPRVAAGPMSQRLEADEHAQAVHARVTAAAQRIDRARAAAEHTREAALQALADFSDGKVEKAVLDSARAARTKASEELESVRKADQSAVRKALAAPRPIAMEHEFAPGYPRKKQKEAAEALAFLASMTGHADGQEGLTYRPRLTQTTDERSHCNDHPDESGRPTLHMAKANDRPAIVVHEAGHGLETWLPGAVGLCKEFLVHRCGSEEPTSLREKFGVSFDRGEMGRKDQFERVFGEGSEKAYYVGKDYGSRGSELLSMAVELLHDDPAGFARKEPEWFRFTIGLLHGSLR